jgi:hypothetical protein
MQPLTLLSEITVNVVMTEAFRTQVVAEIRGRIEYVELRLAQFDEILAASPSEEYERIRLRAERESSLQRKHELEWRIREAESVQVGATLFYRTVSGLVTVQPGDSFEEAFHQEIVIKDGLILNIGPGAAG